MITTGALPMTEIITIRHQRPQRDDCRGIDHLPVLALTHCLVDVRLEALLIDHQVRRGQAGDLPRRQLQVVWLAVE